MQAALSRDAEQEGAEKEVVDKVGMGTKSEYLVGSRGDFQRPRRRAIDDQSRLCQRHVNTHTPIWRGWCR